MRLDDRCAAARARLAQLIDDMGAVALAELRSMAQSARRQIAQRVRRAAAPATRPEGR